MHGHLDVAVEPDGNVYISERFGRVRRVDPGGTITTVADDLGGMTFEEAIAGTIVERHVVLGQSIEPEKPLFKILDDSVMIVEGDAFEDILPLLNLGQPVRVRIPAYPNQVFEGHITFIGPTVDPQKRTVPVWVQLRNHDGMLKQNLFADLSVVMGENHGSLAIPLEGLMSAEGGDFVFVEQGGVFVRRDLVLGARDDRYVEVKKGLEAGDRVVTDGRRQLYTRYLMMQRGSVDLGGHAH